MMHRKSLLFAGAEHPITTDLETAWKLHPRTVRELGRKVPKFSEDMWEKHRFQIVSEGNYLKFSQNEDLKQKLLATGVESWWKQVRRIGYEESALERLLPVQIEVNGGQTCWEKHSWRQERG